MRLCHIVRAILEEVPCKTFNSLYLELSILHVMCGTFTVPNFTTPKNTTRDTRACFIGCKCFPKLAS